MSGRLIILPKKSYCPWNPQNVERVLRDERRHAEAQEQAAAREETAQAQQRLDTIKGKKNTNMQRNIANEDPVEEESQSEGGRFSLFAQEEQAAARLISSTTTSTSEQKNAKSSSDGIQPLYLGQSAKDVATFYKRENSRALSSSTEKRLKSSMDPMGQFDIQSLPHSQAQEEEEPKLSAKSSQSEQRSSRHKHSNQKIKRKHKRDNDKRHLSQSTDDDSSSDTSSSDDSRRRHRKHRRKSSSRHRRKERKHSQHRKRDGKQRKSESSRDHCRDSIEELRKRRLEREEQEKQRQDSVLHGRATLSRKYQDQYNPGLSRR